MCGQPVKRKLSLFYIFSFTVVVLFAAYVMYSLYMEMKKNNTQYSMVPMQSINHGYDINQYPQLPKSVQMPNNLSYMILHLPNGSTIIYRKCFSLRRFINENFMSSNLSSATYESQLHICNTIGNCWPQFRPFLFKIIYTYIL